MLTFEVLIALLSYLIKEGKGRSMVVRPVIVGDLAMEVSFSVISGSLRCIDEPVLVAVSLR